MGKTLQAIINWVDEVVPNAMETTTKQVFLSDLLGEGDFKNFNTARTYLDTYTVADQSDYDLPTGIKVDDIIRAYVSPTTYNSTDVVGSTTLFEKYTLLGIDSEKSPGFVEYTTQIHLIPTPDDSYHMRLIYKPVYRGNLADTTSLATEILAQKPLIDWLQNKLAARVCKSLAFPRIDLGNNYELEAEEKLSAARLEYYQDRRKRCANKIGWKDWWD